MNIETWTGLGSLGMAIMFILLFYSFFNFLIGPQEEGPQRVTDANALLIQIVSISGAPSLILAGVVFGMRKTDESKSASMVIIATGILLLVGTVTTFITMVPKIDEPYIIQGIDLTSYVFILGGAWGYWIGHLFITSQFKGSAQTNCNFQDPWFASRIRGCAMKYFILVTCFYSHLL